MDSLILNYFISSLFLQNCLCAVVWPTPRQTFTLEEPKPVDKYLDCEYDRYVPNVNNGKWGSGEKQRPVFELKNGATIKRCIFSGVDGIHCLGGCTVEDCWNEDIGEDSVSLFGTDPNAKYLIQGGGAKFGDGKVIQINGAGITTVNNFYVRQYVVGVNKNYGDQATLKDIHILGTSADRAHPCKVFDGNNKGVNPSVLISEDKSGGDGQYCKYAASDIHINS
uniref:Probable pectate lyase F n=1 Tax=Meloidogyne hapla TaxID=6305 RepID=A0A1I8B925_MELHA